MSRTYQKEGLSKRVAIGGAWVLALRVASQVFSIIRLIILARILAPDDFGLMGIALLTMSTLETFSQTGFEAALIQRQKNVDEYLDSAWTVLIIRGLILFSILYFTAPYASNFFHTPQAKPIIQIAGFSILFLSFSNIGIILFQKELEFNKQFIYQFSGTVADFITAISAALILKSAWALVFGLLAGNFVRFIASYILSPYRPRLCFDFRKSMELLGFGKWIFGSTVLIFLITRGDSIFVGKMLGVTALGFYELAQRISNMPSTELTRVISQVTFPAYSKIQDNIPKLREAYLKVLKITAFLSFMLASLIFVFAPDFVRIFLGEKWIPVVPVMQILVIAGLARSIAATTGPVFKAVGKPNIDTLWQVVRLFVLITCIYPFTIQWGMEGTSFAVLLSILVSMIGFSIMVIRITGCGLKNFVKFITVPCSSAAIMTLSMLTLMNNINYIGSYEFFALAVVSILIYLLLIYLSDRFFNYGLQSLIRESLSSLKGS